MEKVLVFLAKPWSSLGFILFAAAHNPRADETLWALGGFVQGLVSEPGVHAVALGVSRTGHALDAATQHEAEQDNEPLPAQELHRMPFPVSP